MRRISFIYVFLLAVSVAFGIMLGLTDARFGVIGTLSDRAKIALRTFLVPDHFANPSRAGGVLFPLDDCNCRRVGWQCPCPSVSSGNGPEERLHKVIGLLRNPARYGSTNGFQEVLTSATGYNRIENADPLVSVARSNKYMSGELRELFFRYDKPSFAVRALALTHDDKEPRSLFLHTTASWTVAETALGIGNPMYLRRVGEDLFQAGHDVVSFDHGSNGHLETALNGYMLLTDGVQIFGIWARSACDAVQFLKSEGRTYDKVVVYGLSRGSRTVEYIRGLCTEIDIAFGDDTFSPDGWINSYWRTKPASFVHSTKYGAWYLHGETFIGNSTAHDMIVATGNPGSKLYIFMQPEAIQRSRTKLELSFGFKDGIDVEAPAYIVQKRTDKHVPENEILVEILQEDFSGLKAFSLFPNR